VAVEAAAPTAEPEVPAPEVPGDAVTAGDAAASVTAAPREEAARAPLAEGVLAGPSSEGSADLGQTAPPDDGSSPLFAPTLVPPAAAAATPSLFSPPTAAPSLFAPPSAAPLVPAPVVPAPVVPAPVVPAPAVPATVTPIPAPEPSVPAVAVPIPVDKPAAKPDPEAERREQRARYREGLAKTRKGFIARLADVFRGKPKVDQNLKDQIEEILFTADIGAVTAQKLLDEVSAVLDRKEIADEDAVWSVIRHKALEILDVGDRGANFSPEHGPYTLLMIGVNGVGKTTTLGKLAARHVEAGRRVLLVAGDTFRAAAGEQLDVWARRVGCDIHLGKDGADPSAVIFDGIARARREGHDVVLCDTAGRLHTKKELMDELQKIRRSASKALSQGRDGTIDAHDTLLALDATIGQNALSQAQLFKETMAFTGVVLTKLDGTAKGGVILGICDELKVPVRYIGIGERVADLRDFEAEAFVDAVFERPDEA
jgi:fused signal recognition particle receptor